MKSEENRFSPVLEQGAVTAPTRQIVPDYRVTTMKLREGVLKSSRRYYRNKSTQTSPFQKRNLDNYPMPHGRQDALQSASGHRQEKRTKQNIIKRAKQDSETLKDYSRQMFDGALKSCNRNGINMSSKSRTYSRARTSMASCNVQNGIRNAASGGSAIRCDANTLSSDYLRNNGPSREGSILYNTRLQLLNSIRIRSHSEPIITYNHDKNKSKAALKKAINEKNLNYTVRPGRGSSYSRAGSVADSTFAGSTCTSADFVLVPLNETYIDKNFSQDLSFSDLSDSLEADKDTIDDDGDNSSVFRPESQQCSRLLPPSTPCGIRLVSLEEDSSSDSEEEPLPTPTDHKKVEAPVPHKSMDKYPKARGQRISEPEPEVKPAHVKIHLKGPHCWVDDATITSELSDQEPDNSANKDPINEDVQKPEAGKTPLVKRISQLEIQNVEKIDTVEKEHNQCVENSLECDVMSLRKVNEDLWPSFLCPSSEKKSREAAIKDWLSQTNFHAGHKGIPLV